MFQPRSYNQSIAISPDDSADLYPFTASGGVMLTVLIYVGTTGDVVAVDQANNAFTFKAVPAGTFLPFAARRVNATNTTALNLLACYAR